MNMEQLLVSVLAAHFAQPAKLKAASISEKMAASISISLMLTSDSVFSLSSPSFGSLFKSLSWWTPLFVPLDYREYSCVD